VTKAKRKIGVISGKTSKTAIQETNVLNKRLTLFEFLKQKCRHFRYLSSGFSSLSVFIIGGNGGPLETKKSTERLCRLDRKRQR
jgi:hypothetical protein